MKPLNSQEIFGNWATLLLPIDSRDRIDFVQLEEEIDVIIASRVNGVYSNGTAGEFHTQSDEEFDRISELLARKCERAELAFQIGVSHMSAQTSLDRLRRIRPLAPSAVQVILPDWFKVSDEEAVAFLERMAEAADPIPLVLYNPPHAKRVLEPKAISLLAGRVPALVGVKVAAAGDQQWFDELGRETAQNLSVFTPGHLLATHLPMGSRGAYSNVACINPAGAQRLYELMTRDLPAAQEVQSRLLSFFAQHITPYITQKGYINAAVDKLLAAIGSWAPVGTRLRWPYRWIPEEDADRLRPIARQQIPELFAPSLT
jgi:4-hydroxy-tetrahydrodipicolinate synthase